MANALGFKQSNSFNNDWRKGNATFKFSQGMVQVTMSEDKQRFVFKEDLLPDAPSKDFLKKNVGTEFYVAFNLGEDSKVSYFPTILPTRWMGLKVKAVDMTRSNGRDNPPAPYSYEANYSNKKVTETAFSIFYEVCEEDHPFFGAQIANRYFYKFANDGTGMTMFDGDYSNPKATRLHTLVDHLECLGAISEPIEWADDGNILPALLNRIKAKNVVVEVSGGSKGRYVNISDMMVSSVQPVSTSSEDEFGFEEDAKKVDEAFPTDTPEFEEVDLNQKSEEDFDPFADFES